MSQFGKPVNVKYPVILHRDNVELCLKGITKRLDKERNLTKRAPDEDYRKKHKENARRLNIIRNELTHLLNQL